MSKLNYDALGQEGINPNQGLDYSALDQPTSSPYAGTTETSIDPNEYSKYLDGDVYPEFGEEFLQKRRAAEQSGLEQFGAMLNQAVVGQMVGGTIEGVGYLFDLKDVSDALTKGETEVGNALSEVGKSIQEWTEESTPIYQSYEPGQFRPDKWSWWMSNAPSVASSLSLMIPSGVAVKGLSTLGKAAGMTGKGLSATSKLALKGTTQAIVSRQMEAMMEASGVQEETFNKLINSGVDYETATKESAKAAADVYKTNWAMLAQDVTQYMTLAKPFGKATADLSVKAAKRLGKDITPVITNKFATIGKDVIGEAGEEGFQYIAGKRAGELAEYRAGLRNKGSLSGTIKESLGEGDFWSSAFFGALGAGTMQTAGKGLNMAKNRIRGLESEDVARIRDIDSWGETVQGLSALDVTGEAIGSPEFNTNVQKLANFGTKLAENGNLDWFIQVADNFENMSKEDQESFGFSTEDLQQFKAKFPTFKQDIQDIGRMYEDALNTEGVSKEAANLSAYNEFIASKYQKEYQSLNADIGAKISDILEVKNASLINANLELEGLSSVQNTLLQELNNVKTEEDIQDVKGNLEFIESLIENKKSEVNELKKELPKDELSAFNKLPTVSTPYKEALKIAKKQQHTNLAYIDALKRRDFYKNPQNATDIAEKQAEVDKAIIKETVPTSTAQEVQDAVERSEGDEVLQTLDLSQAISQASDEQAAIESDEVNLALSDIGKKQYDTIQEVLSSKYPSENQLFRQDFNRLKDYFNETAFAKRYDNNNKNEIISDLASRIRSGLEADMSLDNLSSIIGELSQYASTEEEIEVASDIIDDMLKVLNKTTADFNSKQDVVLNTLNIATQQEPSIKERTVKQSKETKAPSPLVRAIKKSEGRYSIKLPSKTNIELANVTASGQSLGTDQDALSSGKVKTGDVIYFEVDKQDQYEIDNKDNPSIRGFRAVVLKGKEKIYIGSIKVEGNDVLRGILNQEINDNYDKYDRFVRANITSVVTGANYNITRSKKYDTPIKKLSSSDLNNPNTKPYGGFLTTYVLQNGKASGNVNLKGITITEDFGKESSGDQLVIVPHPIVKGEYMYLKAYVNNVGEYKELATEGKYNNLINNITGLFNKYRDNIDNGVPNQSANNILDSIKEMIVVKPFTIKGNNIVLQQRNKKEFATLPLDTFTSTDEFINWINDSKLKVNNKKLNTTSQSHVLPTGKASGRYNSLIDGYFSLNVKEGQYIEDVQIIIEDPSYKVDTPEKPDLTEDVVISKLNILNPSEDPGDSTKESLVNEGNVIKPEETSTEEVKDDTDFKKIPSNIKIGNSNKNVLDKLKQRLDDAKDLERSRVAIDSNLPKWNKSEELKWFNQNFPNVPISVLDNLKNVVANGKEYWGVFTNASIYVTENAAPGTVYHEAFHALFWLYNDQKQRDILFNEAKGRYLDIKRKNYSTEEEYYIALEERMADEFMEYTQLAKAPDSILKKFGNKILNFFKSIYQTIKSLQKNPVYSIDELFWRGNNGFYKKPVIKPTGFSDPVNRFRPKGWTYAREKEAVDTVNTILLQDIIPLYKIGKYSNLTDVEIINNVGLDVLYKDAIQNFIDLYNELDESITKESIAELVNNFYDFSSNQFKELLESSIRGLELYNIRVNRDNYNVSDTEKTDASEDTSNTFKDFKQYAEDKVEAWQNSAIERSSKDNALAVVKNFIRNMRSNNKNSFGFKSAVNYNVIYDTLLKDLSGSTSVDDVVIYLTKDLSKNPEYQQILDEFDNNPIFKTQFFSAFNKAYTQANVVANMQGDWVTFISNRKGVTSTIINNWRESILDKPNVVNKDAKGQLSIDNNINTITSNIRKNIDYVIKNWSPEVTESFYSDLSNSLDDLGLSMSAKTLTYIGSDSYESYYDGLGNKTFKVIDGKQGLNKFFYSGPNSFDNILNKFENKLNPFEAEDIDVTETAAINNAANMVYKSTPELMEDSYRTMDGQIAYSYLEQNYLTKLVNRFKNPLTKNDAISTFEKDKLFVSIDDEGETVFHNRILTDLLNDEDIFDIQITLGLADENGKQISYRNMDKTSLSLYTIANYYNNGKKKEAWFRSPVLSDSPNGILFKNRKSSKEEVLDGLLKYAKAENERILDIKRQNSELEEHEKVKNYHTKDNGSLKNGYHFITALRGKTVDFSTEDGKQKVVKTIDVWLKDKSKAYYQSLKDSGIIVIKDGKIDKEASRIGKKILNKYNTEEALYDFIEEFYYNDYLSRIEFTTITAIDPAFYKPGDNNNKTVDFIKRVKQIYSPKSLLDTSAKYFHYKTGEEVSVGTKYKTMYLSDNEIKSPSIDAINQNIDKLVDSKIISKQKGKEIKSSYDNVNQTDAQAYVTLPFYRKTMIGAGLWTDKHQEAYDNLIDGRATGEDTALMLQPLKPFMYGTIYSEKINRLIPVQNKNSEFLLLPSLVEGNTKLENLYKFMIKNDIDSVNFDSAVKAGLSYTVNSDTFELENKINELQIDLESDSGWIHNLPMEDRGIQQEVPEHFVDANNLFGTQIRKLIMSDLYDGTTYLGMTPSELRKEYESLIMADLQEAFDDLQGKFIDGNTGKINYKTVHEILLEEARSRGKGEEFEKTIQYDEANDRLALPLFNPVSGRAAENLLTSIFKSKITKQKIKGGAFVQLSSWGLTKELELVYNDDGGLEYAEVMLPAWSKKFFKDFMNKDGDVDFDGIKATSPEILDMIGYRIPTEDKYSMLPLRVIGFLPYNSGGAIMLPADITKISGSDFDVDKMYVMMKGFDNNLNPYTYKEKVDISKLSKEEKDTLYKEYNVESDKDLQKELDKTINTSKEARDNRKIDIMMSVLRNPYTLESILDGGTFKPLQDIARFTTKGVDRGLDPISTSSMDEMHQANMAGKSMVGIAANENAFHAIAQHTNLELKTPVLFDKSNLSKLNNTKAKFYVDISSGKIELKEDFGNRISKNKAYYLAAVVDNAKDPVAASINYNEYTSGFVGLFTQLGLDPATITWFLKQPVIEDITNKFFQSGQDRTVEKQVIDEYKSKFKVDKPSANNLNTKELFDNLNTKADTQYQKQVFESFLVYKKIADDWTSLILSSRGDTSGFGPTLANSEVLLDSIDNILLDEKFSINNVEDLFKVTDEDTNIVSMFTNIGIKDPLGIVNQLFPYSWENGLYRDVKTTISSYIKGRDLTADERNKINSQITTYLLSDFDVFDPTTKDYFINKFPKQFYDLKNKSEELSKNPLTRRLYYRSEDKRVKIDRIEFDNPGKITNEVKDDIQKGWIDLYNNVDTRDLATDLFKYSYFTTGLGFEIKGFSHFLSADLLTKNGIKDSKLNSLSDFMYSIIEVSENANPELATEFLSQFYKNNYKNRSFVPRVTDESPLYNDKKEIIGYMLNEGSDLVANSIYPPFISKQLESGEIELYEKTASSDQFSYYIKTNKLGYPNYITEYMRGGYDLWSSVKGNNIKKNYTLSEASTSKSKVDISYLYPSAIREGSDVSDISDEKVQIKSHNRGNSPYKISFVYNNSSYAVQINENGDYINLKTNKKIDNDSALARIVMNKVLPLINKTIC